MDRQRTRSNVNSKLLENSNDITFQGCFENTFGLQYNIHFQLDDENIVTRAIVGVLLAYPLLYRVLVSIASERERQ